MSSPDKLSARDRLVKAAATVFAENGLDGATTREIARLAGVNEVTLFRHFQSKDGLLAAVVEHVFEDQKECGASPLAAPEEEEALTDAESDLRTILALHAKIYHELLETHFPLIRALIGGIHRHQEHEERVMKALFILRRQRLARSFESARRRGLIRKDVDLAILADQFAGMIFFNLLRRTKDSVVITYTTDQYLEASIELLARGIEHPQAAKRTK